MTTTTTRIRGKGWAFAAITLLVAVVAWIGPAPGSLGPRRVSAAAFVLNGNASKGKKPFKQNCVACHGKKGDGKGVAAAGLNPKPASFRDAVRMGKITDKQLYSVIREGGPAIGKSPVMTAWKSVLSDQEIRDVAAYVRAFAKGK